MSVQGLPAREEKLPKLNTSDTPSEGSLYQTSEAFSEVPALDEQDLSSFPEEETESTSKVNNFITTLLIPGLAGCKLDLADDIRGEESKNLKDRTNVFSEKEGLSSTKDKVRNYISLKATGRDIKKYWTDFYTYDIRGGAKRIGQAVKLEKEKFNQAKGLGAIATTAVAISSIASVVLAVATNTVNMVGRLATTILNTVGRSLPHLIIAAAVTAAVTVAVAALIKLAILGAAAPVAAGSAISITGAFALGIAGAVVLAALAIRDRKLHKTVARLTTAVENLTNEIDTLKNHSDNVDELANMHLDEQQAEKSEEDAAEAETLTQPNPQSIPQPQEEAETQELREPSEFDTLKQPDDD